MNRQEREALQAWLDADPALRAAWDGFQGSLARVAAQLPGDPAPDLDELRQAARKLRDEAGEDQPTH